MRVFDKVPQSQSDYDLFVTQLRNYVYGSTTAQEFLFRKKYHEHNDRVLHSIPANQLLVMNISDGDGWEKLCPFLGVATPIHPFPHENKGDLRTRAGSHKKASS
jgi:hypothetical protein